MIFKFNRRKSEGWNQVEVKQTETEGKDKTHYSDSFHIYDPSGKRIAIVDKSSKSKYIKMQLLDGYYVTTGSDFEKFN